MGISATAGRYNETLTTFYIEELAAEADKVYRFGFALTMSPEGAKWCVDHTFKSIADTLEGVYAASRETDVLVLAIKETWQAVKSKSFKQGGSPLVKALSSLSEIERAVVAAIDVIGLSHLEAEFALGLSGNELRASIANGRKKLLAQKI